MKKLWICGQLRGNWRKGGSVWDFQGVFSSRLRAVLACRKKPYFVFSAKLNEELPARPLIPPDAFYPRWPIR